MKPLDQLREELDKCVRCGTCRSVCPTFKVIGRETASARGRVSLIDAHLKGEIGLTEAYLKHLKECTLCGACGTNCPNSVDTVAIFAAARAEAVEKEGLPMAASVIFRNLVEPGRLDWGLKLASRIQGLLFKGPLTGGEAGLLSRFPLPLMGGGRLLPPLAKSFFLELREVRDLSGRKQRTKAVRVAFYAGCGINYLMPEVGVKSLDVLKRAGVDVIVPEGQVCCGMPAYSMGDLSSTRSLAIKNLEEFESCDYDFITTSCATCGHGLKKLLVDALSYDPGLKARAERIASRVRDISELLVDELKWTSEKKTDGPEKVVTYHDPCHLGRAQGVREAPRRVIAMGSNVVLKEMKNPCLCCGLGGGLSVANYELSMEIARKKAENIRKSGAEIVATACPGCMVQLRDGLHRFGVKARVAHVVELL